MVVRCGESWGDGGERWGSEPKERWDGETNREDDSNVWVSHGEAVVWLKRASNSAVCRNSQTRCASSNGGGGVDDNDDDGCLPALHPETWTSRWLIGLEWKTSASMHSTCTLE
jgi:hypothetical protein